MNELTRRAFTDAVHAYQIPDGVAKQQAIARIVEGDQSKAIDEWLKHNPVAVKKSPMLLDLQTRLVRAMPSPGSAEHGSIFQRVTGKISGLFSSLTSGLEGSKNYVEEAILSGSFDALHSTLSENPDELLNQADLIKLHLSLGSLTFKELAPVLGNAAIELKAREFPSSAYASVQSPSLLRIFKDEIFQSLLTSHEGIEQYLAVFNALADQDEASDDPVLIHKSGSVGERIIALMPADILFEFVSAKDSDGNIPLQNVETLRHLLPLLLQKLTTGQLEEVFKITNAQGETASSILFANWHVLASLSSDQYLRFAAFAASFEELPAGVTDILPGFAQEYRNIIRGAPDARRGIQEIDRLNISEDDKRAAISCYIEKKKCALSATGLSNERIVGLASSLQFADVRGLDVRVANELIKNCPNLNTLYISDDKMLEGVDELIQCQNFKGENLTKLPKLPRCQDLSLNNCESLATLTDLPMCQILHISNCKNLKNLPPALPSCKDFTLLLCHKIWQLPELHECKYLDCVLCHNLKKLPQELPQCKKFSLDGCPNVRKLPEKLPLCENFECDNTGVAVIPDLPECRTFSSSSNQELTRLPAALPRCEAFGLSDCARMEEISIELPLCQKFKCADCASLRIVRSNLPQCLEFICRSCINVGSLPGELPQCQRVDITGCSQIFYAPSVPDTASVIPYRANVAPSMSGMGGDPQAYWLRAEVDKIWISLKDLESSPKRTIEKLVSIDKFNFPHIGYLGSEGADAGGLRRDFVTRLCANLFKTYDHMEEDSQRFLWRSESGMPEIKSPEEVTAYKTLGKIFAICWNDIELALRTGPLFNEEVYSYFLAQGEIGSDEWFLRNHMGLAIEPPELIDWLADPTKKWPTVNDERMGDKGNTIRDLQLDERSLMFLTYMVNPEFDPDEEGATVLTQKYLIQHREEIRKAIVANARQNKVLIPVMHMAKAMKDELGRSTWNHIREKGGIALKERIEGVLSAEALIKQLKWYYNSDEQNDSRFLDTQKYLTDWVKRADDKTLKKFLQAVTGLQTISDKLVIMDVYNRGPEYIPSAHTCGFKFVLSAEYGSQEKFDEKIKIFMDHALEGTGFQFS